MFLYKEWDVFQLLNKGNHVDPIYRSIMMIVSNNEWQKVIQNYVPDIGSGFNLRHFLWMGEKQSYLRQLGILHYKILFC